MTLTFAGCNSTGDKVIDGKAAAAAERRRPALPPPPADFGRPVPVPSLRQGSDARVELARSRAAHRQANRRLDGDRVFYDSVRKEYSR